MNNPTHDTVSDDKNEDPQHVYMFTVDDSYSNMTTISIGIAVFIFGLLSLLIIVGAARETPIRIENFLFALAPIGLIVLVVRQTEHFKEETWLKLSPNGLTYHTPGLTIASNWDNVREVREEFGQAYLILDRRSSSMMSSATAFARHTSSAAWNIDKRIPLHFFAVWTNKSLLYQKIHEYAPHIVVNRRSMRGF